MWEKQEALIHWDVKRKRGRIMQFRNDDERREIGKIVKYYMDSEYWEVVDINTVLDRAKYIEERNIIEFDMYFMKLYLDSRDYSYVDAHPSFPN